MRNIILSFFLILAVPLSAQFDPANPKIQGVTVLTKTNPIAVGPLTTSGLKDTGGGTLTFTTSSVDKWVINSSGGLVPNINNTYDIGNGSVNPRDITVARNAIVGGNVTGSYFAVTNTTVPQFVIFYDASNSTPFTVSSGGDLTIAPTGSDFFVTGRGTFSSDLKENGGDIIIEYPRWLYWVSNGLALAQMRSLSPTAFRFEDSSATGILTVTVPASGNATLSPSGGTLTAGGNIFVVNGYTTVPTTIVTPGTTGNTTINKMSGRVNIAAAGTAVTVTNSIVTANSIIVATAATADSTATVKNVVAASGQFTINTVAVTAETAFNFIVITP